MTKENIGVDFAEELDEEIETQGEGSRTSRSDRLGPSVKNQAESKPHVIPIFDSSKHEGCLNVPSGITSGGGFDDNLTIHFNAPFLSSPTAPNLEFMDQTSTPQSKIPVLGDTSDPADPLLQGQPLELKQ